MNPIPTSQPLSPTTSGRDDNNSYCPLWKLTGEQLNEFQVTPLSKYKDIVWCRKPMTPGHLESDASINWAMKLRDGSKLTDPQHARRLAWAKKLMALILHAPANGHAPADLSIPEYQQGFNWLLSWMIEQALHLPKELTSQVIENYINDLPRFITERSDSGDDDISKAQVSRALFILPRLWNERVLMAKWDIPSSLDIDPFYKRGIHAYAKDIATKANGWIPPLPDEVAIPLLNKASWFLGEPAEDVIAMVNQVINDPISGQEILVQTKQSLKGTRMQKAGRNKKARNKRSNQFLAGFNFQKLPGDKEPWHPYIGWENEGANRHPLVRLRQLYETVRSACAITIQGITGMRISEFLGIQAGFEEDSGLPKGVRIESSASGLYDLFLIRTILSKTEKGMPREVDWILGMRPTGTKDEPSAVRALRILNRLQAPWREHATTPLLLIADKYGETLPLKTTALGAITYNSMLRGMRAFIERWVDLSTLPDQSAHAISDNDLVRWRESKGLCFTTHMLRKTWARFVFAVHPRLMPAIALQFHHLSIAMTDSGYIGNNPMLVSTMNVVAEQNTYNIMFEAVTGKGILAGKMGEQIRSATRDLAKEVKHLPTTEAYKRVRSYCERIGLNTFFGPHGGCCPVNASKMRCHDEAETPIAIRKQPNYSTRQPSLCAGCDCFILDEQHVPFWQNRYLENQIAYQRAEAQGISHKFTVIKGRGVQAGKLLKAIGIDLAPLDQHIKHLLVGDDYVVT